MIAIRKIDLNLITTVGIILAYIIIGIVSGQWDKAWIIILLIPIINIILGPHSILDFSASDTKKKFTDFIKKDFIDIDSNDDVKN